MLKKVFLIQDHKDILPRFMHNPHPISILDDSAINLGFIKKSIHILVSISNKDSKNKSSTSLWSPKSKNNLLILPNRAASFCVGKTGKFRHGQKLHHQAECGNNGPEQESTAEPWGLVSGGGFPALRNHSPRGEGSMFRTFYSCLFLAFLGKVALK